MTIGKILITGATGFVGRHVVTRLLASPCHLILAVRSIAACPQDWRGISNLDIVETGNLESSTNLDTIFQDVTTVVHLAGLTHLLHRFPQNVEANLMRANAEATARLASTAERHRVRSFIHLGSLASITGNTSQHVVNDDTCHEPSTPYGHAKWLSEQHVLSLSARGIFSVTLRPPLIVGGHAKGNWASLQRLASSGLPLPFAAVRNRRSLVSSDTVAAAIAHLCTGHWPLHKSGNYCIADPGPLSLAEIIKELRTGMGLPARLVPCPIGLLQATAYLLNQQHRAASLLGTLEVDASRFSRTFDFRSYSEPRQFIRQSGGDYWRLRNSDDGQARAIAST